MAIKFLSSGNVTGGLTLSGSLSGTSATFSGTVTASGTVTLQKSIQLPATTTGSGTPSDVGVLSFGGNYTTGNRLFLDSSGGTFRIQGSANLILEAPNHNIKNSNGFLILAGDTGVRLYYLNSEKLTTTSTGVKVDGNIKIGIDTMSTPSTNANDIVIDKDASEAGITMMSQAAGSVRWGDASNSSVGSIEYNHNSDYMRFIVNAAERMRIDSSGNIAIGPDALDIQIKAASNNSGNNLIYMRGNASDDKSSLQMNHFGYADYYIGVGHVGNGKFNISNDLTGNDFVIDTSGNVGIGTLSPGTKLDVNGAGSTGTISWANDGGRKRGYLYSDSAGVAIYSTSLANAGIYLADNVQIDFRVNGGVKMLLNSDGNLGIGETSPEFKLDVKSNSDTAPSAYLRGGKSSQGEIQNTGLIVGTQTTMVAGDYQGISFTGYTSSSAIRRARAAIGVEAINGPGKMDLVFLTRFADDGTQLSDADEKMRITSGGDILMGNTVVNPASGFATQKGFGYDAGTGQTQIATTDNASTLVLGRNNATDGSIIELRKESVVIGTFGSNTTGGQTMLDISANATNGNMRFLTANAERMRIDSVGLATFRSTYIVAGLYGGEVTLGGASTTFGLQLKYSQEAATTSTIYHSPGYTSNDNLFKLGSGSGNSNQLVLKGNGNVGIGTDSPSAKLEIKATGASAGLTFRTTDSSNNETFYINDGGTVGVRYYPFKIGVASGTTNVANSRFQVATTAGDFVILNDGKTGIGTTSPGSILDIVDTSGTTTLTLGQSGEIPEIKAGGTNTDLRLSAVGPGGFLDFQTNATSRMRITSGGEVFIRRADYTDTTFSLQVGDAASDSYRPIRCQVASTSTRTQIAFYNPSGLVGTISTSGTSTAYNTSSDYRLKENVVEMTGALNRVSQLKPSRFNFIADADKTVDGFLAHEVQEIVPEAITGEKDGVDEDGNPDYQGIDQSKLVPLLVGAIQELKAEIELLKNK